MRDIRFLLKPHYKKSYALVIGINKYEAAPNLSYAVNDAREMKNALVGDLQFPEENVVILEDDAATKQKILTSFARFQRDDIEADDRIVLFYAGHGHTRSGLRGEVGFLVPYDGNIEQPGSLIRWTEFTLNADLIPAKHVFFIMDACYGGLALTRNVGPGSVRFLNDMYLRFARQVLTAGKADEVVADSGGPLSGHSIFTGHLIEGIRGKAITEHGVLTALGLMAYVYRQVASDKNSNQTPHFGSFDGDGDFILIAPKPQSSGNSNTVSQDVDRLLIVPAAENGDPNSDNTEDKVAQIKIWLASEQSSIELHDFMISEVRRFLAVTTEDNFKVQGQFSKEELLDRLSKYDAVSGDLALLTACAAYWARPVHVPLIRKIVSRSSDRLEPQSGLVIWSSLRWYPLIRLLYASGIAAVDARRFDSLAAMLYAPVPMQNYKDKTETFAENAAGAIAELYRVNAFKSIPEHDRFHVPMSEYLFKILQPGLDDVLFLGRNYEQAFDYFEVMFALTVVDIYKAKDVHVWAPIGRFGWKHRGSDRSPLAQVIQEAGSAGASWEPLKAGLFGTSVERFRAAAEELGKMVSQLNWY